MFFFSQNKHKEKGFKKLFLYGQLYSQYKKEEKIKFLDKTV